jgi:dihydrofolate reductase
MISIIAAIAEDRGIGRDNSLLWHLPEDLKRFKKLTFGKTVIMGKKTWESLPVKPLKGRRNIVITDDPLDRFDDAEAAFSIWNAIEKCDSGGEAFVIGGGSIYRQFLPYADRLYITHVHETAPADTYFPEIDTITWKAVEKEEHQSDDSNKPSYTYVVYYRQVIQQS